MKTNKLKCNFNSSAQFSQMNLGDLSTDNISKANFYSNVLFFEHA